MNHMMWVLRAQMWLKVLSNQRHVGNLPPKAKFLKKAVQKETINGYTPLDSAAAS